MHTACWRLGVEDRLAGRRFLRNHGPRVLLLGTLPRPHSSKPCIACIYFLSLFFRVSSNVSILGVRRTRSPASARTGRCTATACERRSLCRASGCAPCCSRARAWRPPGREASCACSITCSPYRRPGGGSPSGGRTASRRRAATRTSLRGRRRTRRSRSSSWLSTVTGIRGSRFTRAMCPRTKLS